jgi:putative IMPACT (imprinted ancient) family translation regulator
VLTLAAAADGVLEARGSRFLARVVPIPGDGDECADLKARRALAPTIAAHPKATHHVTAWRALDTGGRIEEHARDDGEPAGTAGRPALRVLQGAELINVATVVVRYYGGVKLGTGGLARAYAGAVRDALEGTELIRWVATASARVFRASPRCQHWSGRSASTACAWTHAATSPMAPGCTCRATRPRSARWQNTSSSSGWTANRTDRTSCPAAAL